jgi:HSP20 family protein
VYREPFLGFRWGFQQEAIWRPATDVYQTDDGAVVTVEIAGVNNGDYEVSLVGRVLVVSGERRDPGQRLAYQQMEIRYGRFRTQVHLPWALDMSSVEVVYDQGFLRITLRKAKAHRIPVQTGQDSDSGAEG